MIYLKINYQILLTILQCLSAVLIFLAILQLYYWRLRMRIIRSIHECTQEGPVTVRNITNIGESDLPPAYECLVTPDTTTTKNSGAKEQPPPTYQQAITVHI